MISTLRLPLRGFTPPARLSVARAFACSLLLAGCYTPHANDPIYMPAYDGRMARPVADAPNGAGDARDGGTRLGPHTLDQCIAAALANNRRISRADRSAAMARDTVNEAWGSIAPSLSASVTAETRSNQAGSLVNGNANEFGPQSSVHGDFTLLVPVYDFGVSSNLRDVYESQVRQADHNAVRERQNLRYAVTAAYYRVLESQRIVQVVSESIEVVKRQLQIAQDFLAQQLVARNDVLAVQTQLAAREQEQIRAENNRELAIAQLNRLMGYNVGYRTELIDLDDAAPDRGAGHFGDLVMLAFASRPDLEVSNEQIAAAQSEYQSVRSSFFPQFYLWGRFNYTSDDSQLQQEWFAAGATLNVPLFNLDKVFRLERSEKGVAQAVDAHRDRIDDMVLDVKDAWLALDAASRQVPVARLGVKLADENLRIERDQYREGLRTSADVLEAEQRLASARSSYYQALYGQHIARARLANVVGVEKLPEE